MMSADVAFRMKGAVDLAIRVSSTRCSVPTGSAGAVITS